MSNEQPADKTALENEKVDFEGTSFDEGTQKKVQTLAAQKEHFREKSQKLAQELEEYKRQPPSAPPAQNITNQPSGDEAKTKNNLEGRLDSLETTERKRQFGYEHGLSPEETDAVFRLNGNPTKETLDDPFVRGGIEAIRSRKRAADNTPSPSNRGFRVPDAKATKDMSNDERQAAFNERQAKRGFRR